MRTQPKNPWLVAILTGGITLAVGTSFALVLEIPNGIDISLASAPTGVANLVNVTNRIGGIQGPVGTTAFFNGTIEEFNTFLQNYSKIEGIETHRIFVHAGSGEAYGAGGTNRRPCDWKVFGCGKGWLNASKLVSYTTNAVEGLPDKAKNAETYSKALKEPGYVLEVHIWVNGPFPLDKLSVPKNVEVKRDDAP